MPFFRSQYGTSGVSGYSSISGFSGISGFNQNVLWGYGTYCSAYTLNKWFNNIFEHGILYYEPYTLGNIVVIKKGTSLILKNKNGSSTSFDITKCDFIADEFITLAFSPSTTYHLIAEWENPANEYQGILISLTTSLPATQYVKFGEIVTDGSGNISTNTTTNQTIPEVTAALNGASGYSGYSGAGASGYSGYSSYSGYTGKSGYSGYSSYSGYSGYSAISYYDISAAYIGKPNAGEKISIFLAPRSVTIPANFSGSYAKSDVAATVSSTFNIQKNGVNVASFVFGVGGSTATFSTQPSISLTAGDKLAIVAPPSRDSTLADISWTIVTQ